jgi:hypothetical protein
MTAQHPNPAGTAVKQQQQQQQQQEQQQWESV